MIRTLYLKPFAGYSASKILVSDLDLSGSPKVKYFYNFWMATCVIIMVSCWYELSVSYRLRDIPHLRFRLVTLSPWPFRVSKGQIFPLLWKAHMQFCNGVLLIRTLYLIPCARYSSSKISVSDLDFSGSSKVKYFTVHGKPIFHICWKAHMRLYIGILLTRTLYLTPFTSYSTSKILGHDISPLGGTVGHKS